jgi:hypothetical protein
VTQISGDLRGESLVPPESGIARSADDAAHATGDVIVIDGHPTFAGRRSVTNCADASLLAEDAVVIFPGDPVETDEVLADIGGTDSGTENRITSPRALTSRALSSMSGLPAAKRLGIPGDLFGRPRSAPRSLSGRFFSSPLRFIHSRTVTHFAIQVLLEP